jgi:hypothetical protein
VKVGKRIPFAADKNVEVAFEVFNLLNAGNFTEWSRQGPNRILQPTDRSRRSRILKRRARATFEVITRSEGSGLIT